ncbi:hypothetical protein LCGC14_0539850 [marine sediment metagenome]|uniref:Uncharacterized protein n=1 Tax=marine sediment metagenome TaxID=412755 RepID=A0A0F9V1A9_9ZZZZ
MYYMPSPDEPTKEERREARKSVVHRRVGRPSNARKFGDVVFRLHDPKGTSKKEAQRIALRLRDFDYNARMVSPLVVGDRVNIPRKYWVYKRKRR